ncbi:MAG: biopolymer transporter ExbD [Pseudomonadota bacterium]
MSISLPSARPARRPSLTPMIDVVFLLLVFFMLASRFGLDMQVPLSLATAGGAYSGAPRLVEVGPDDLRLNGFPASLEEVSGGLDELVSDRADLIVIRPLDDASLQRVVDILEALDAEGFTSLVLVD